jgi:hypothetical protein
MPSPLTNTKNGPSGDVPYKMTFGRGAKHHPLRARTTGNTDDKPA